MLVLTPADLAQFRVSDLDAFVERRQAAVVVADGDVRGLAAAALLFADWAALREDATLIIDRAEAWAGVASRLGRALGRFYFAGNGSLTAHDAKERGLCDALVPRDVDADQWVAHWLGERSELALDAGAMLTRARGGDVLERYEFARLFAAGEPQKGLAAFLGRRRRG